MCSDKIRCICCKIKGSRGEIMKKLSTFNPLAFPPVSEMPAATFDGNLKVYVLGQCGGNYPALYQFASIDEALQAIFTTMETTIDGGLSGCVLFYSYYNSNHDFVTGQYKILLNDEVMIVTPVKIDMWQRAYAYGAQKGSLFHFVRTMSKSYENSFDETREIDFNDYANSDVRIFGIPTENPTSILPQIADFCRKSAYICAKSTAAQFVKNWDINNEANSTLW